MESQLCESLLKLRGNLARGEFLRRLLYTHDESQFAGSTHTYLAKVGLLSDKSRILKSLANCLPRDSLYIHSAMRLLERFSQRLPPEVCTLVEVPHETPPAEAADECRRQGQAAIDRCLPAHIPYAWFFVGASRLIRCHSGLDISATNVEKRSLLENYHQLGTRKVRERFPEVWDTARGDYLFDSRGVQFADDFCRELTRRGLLGRDTHFLDIGSGIGTMLIAVNLWSDAQATGIESHSGLMRFAELILHRLDLKGAVTASRISLIVGDGMCDSTVDISRYDVLYVYSPLGKSQIDLDPIVGRMQAGSLLVSERLPTNNLGMVKFEPRICDLFLLRKVV